MQKYAEILGASPAGAVLNPAVALTVPPPSGAITAPAEMVRAALTPSMVGAAVVGAAIGWKLWKGHPILGAITGLSSGGALYNVVQGFRGPQDAQKQTLKNFGLVTLGANVAAVTASKKWSKHPTIGFWAGGIAASAVGVTILKKMS